MVSLTQDCASLVLHPTDEDLSAGTPVLHPTDEDLSAGTPVLHPTDEDLSAGTPVLGYFPPVPPGRRANAAR